MTKKVEDGVMPKEEKGKEKVEKIKHVNIYAALSAFQGELKTIEQSKTVKIQTKTGGEYSFKYAPLSEIMAVCYPLLGKNGLSVRHELTEKGIECILTHETVEEKTITVSQEEKFNEAGSGSKVLNSKIIVSNELRSGVIAISKGSDMKDLGGQITYARRYSLTMLLGIASEEDKDAEFENTRKENVEKFAMASSRKGIENCQTPEAVALAISHFDRDLKLIESGKAPILGLTKENYEELKELAVKKQVELHKAKSDITIHPDQQ